MGEEGGRGSKPSRYKSAIAGRNPFVDGSLPVPPCQHTLWEKTGVARENPPLSAECLLFSFHMRTGFESTLLGFKLETLEVKGKWSDY